MAGRPALVSQAEIKRTVAAAIEGGLRIGKIEVDHRTGKVAIFPEGVDADVITNPCDRLLK
ncbi:hypothetical protein [Rhodobacter maris]|uniref:Uncharacterized protein n=1 Tax=Rhodobacter maris TaxID=446682 RepID=A0A285S4X2_9RHOB|nr:hypothetical protein [Rhodobacter maris]SOC02193.1 hypothetical protein SAMN05877831_103100 [Rhodobacter maris]